jgi:single-strand DNA-binding protein
MHAKAFIIGHLGKDPELRTLSNGNKVASLSVATSRRWKDKDSGDRKEKTFWHRVVLYSKQSAEFAEKYLKKGMKVWVEGDLETREYEKDGKPQTITEVVVSAFSGSIQSLDKIEGAGGDPVPTPDEDGFADLPY